MQGFRALYSFSKNDMHNYIKLSLITIHCYYVVLPDCFSLLLLIADAMAFSRFFSNGLSINEINGIYFK